MTTPEYAIVYHENHKRNMITLNLETYKWNDPEAKTTSICGYLLTIKEALGFSPVSITFKEFTKHFVIVNPEVLFEGTNEYTVENIPENQEELYEELMKEYLLGRESTRNL